LAEQSGTDLLIRETAIQLFGSKGFEGTGIRELAKGVGLTPAALYHYMGSKQDLLVAIMRDGSTQLKERAVQALADAGDDPTDRFAALVRNHVLVHCEAPLRSQVNDYEIRSLTPVNRRSIIKIRNSYEALWVEALERGIDAGLFKISDVRVCRLSLLQMCTGVANWFTDEGLLSREEVADEIVGLSLQAVGVSPPTASEAPRRRRTATAGTKKKAKKPRR